MDDADGLAGAIKLSSPAASARDAIVGATPTLADAESVRRIVSFSPSQP